MQVKTFSIQGPLLIEPKVFGDHRGFFVERYKESALRELGVTAHFIQDNYSRSQQGVLRGLHYQFDKPQAKLVTATAGRIVDVIVDLRQNSETFGQSLSVELDGGKPAWLWVPVGFAHGFAVLSEAGADILYKVDSYYNSHGEAGIRWNDPDLAIDWPVRDPQISARDADMPSWKDYARAPRF